MPHRFAVLIGVDQYDGGAPLRAPTHDVADWYRLLRRLDLRDGHIRVLSSPTLTAIELGSAALSCAPATTAEVQAALTWLADSLAAAGEDALGVVFFAGHGDLRARAGSALYLQDYAGAPPDAARADAPFARGGALDLEVLRRRIDAAAPQASLLAIVDACRPAAGAGALAGPIAGVDAAWSEGRHVLITAADRGQDSYERCLDGRWRGQLTWAATTLIDQWSTACAPGSGRYPDLSPRVLVERAGALIAAISPPDQPQTPRVHASPARTEASLMSGLGAPPPAPAPMGAPGHEWGPNTTGIVKAGNGSTIGAFQVNAAGANPAAWYWFQNGIPNNSNPVRFQVGPLPDTSQMTRYQSTSGSFGSGQYSFQGSFLANAELSIGCQFQPSGILWMKEVVPQSPQPPVYLPPDVQLTQSVSSLGTLPPGGQVWMVYDALTPG
jgi:hypothetical protein